MDIKPWAQAEVTPSASCPTIPTPPSTLPLMACVAVADEYLRERSEDERGSREAYVRRRAMGHTYQRPTVARYICVSRWNVTTLHKSPIVTTKRTPGSRVSVGMLESSRLVMS